MRTCACGSLFPVHPNERHARIWCSEACRVRHARYGARTDRPCRQCGAPFRAADKQRYCSARCGWLWRSARRPKNADWVAGRRSLRTVSCIHCSASVDSRASRPICEACRTSQNATRAAAKNARRRGAASENVAPRMVFERDGWLCYLCRFRVSRNSSRNDPLRPTLDHVVPIARGGRHEMANLKTAHLFCNTSKGARRVGPGDLRDRVLEVAAVRRWAA